MFYVEFRYPGLDGSPGQGPRDVDQKALAISTALSLSRVLKSEALELIDHTRLGWALNPKAAVLIRRSHEERQAYEKEGQMKTEAKMGVMCLQGKECQGLPATTRN